MYFPSDDSIFLSDIVNQYHGQLALEVGTSSGIILKELSKNFRIAIGTDLDLNSLIHSQSILKNDKLICCDAASALYNVKFDLIVTNPPYLPNNPNHVDKTIDGGPSGIEVSIHILTSALDKLTKAGKILIVVSSLSNKKKLERFIVENNLVMKQIAKKNLFYESLEIMEISRKIKQ
ncbi:MAG TPA: methyltransferase [Nitrososphaeraceae archaeon]|nr:methyltransferase [Nitrososphaeraceae archaeon]